MRETELATDENFRQLISDDGQTAAFVRGCSTEQAKRVWFVVPTADDAFGLATLKAQVQLKDVP